MKEIQLTRGHVASVDDADYEHLSVFSWQAQRSAGIRENWYAVRTTSRREGKRRTIGMHREIMGIVQGMDIDHKDHNGLNNQRENLRICTRHMNLANRVHPGGSSNYRGVHWSKSRRKWVAKARNKMKYVWIGDFDDPREAAIARDKVVFQLCGEFAILNFPEEATA